MLRHPKTVEARVKNFLKDLSELKTWEDRIKYNVPNNPTLSPAAPPFVQNWKQLMRISMKWLKSLHRKIY